MDSAGDLFGFPEGGDETVEAAQERDRVRALAVLDRLPRPVLHVMGNGDFAELRGEPPRRRALHGRRVDLGTLTREVVEAGGGGGGGGGAADESQPEGGHP